MMTVRWVSTWGLTPLLGLVVLACGSSERRPAGPPPPVRPGFEEIMVGVVRRLVEPLGDGAVARFYTARQFRPAWVDAGNAERVRQTLEVIARAGEDGLDARRYATSSVQEMLMRARGLPESLAAVDVQLSALVLAFARDLAVGQIDPTAIDSLWRTGNTFDVVAAVAAAVDAGAVRELPDRLRPPHVGYAALRAALARHRSTVPTAADTAADVAARIALNLERWRWLPRDLGRRHVMVNFAAFEATAVEEGVESLRTRVVAGRRDWPTPIASGQLTVVVVNPRWNVPREIAVQEILPAIRADSGFLDREGMAVYRGARRIDPRKIAWDSVSDTAFRFSLVQAPGPRNPLGRVKLVFANPFNVALHDTPSRALFAQSERAASHGCVRLERAVDVAAWAVGLAGRDSLLAALRMPEERVMAPGGPVMVHLAYWNRVGVGGRRAAAAG